MKNLYCFDFDGTLTKRDSMFMFLKFYDSKRYYIQLVRYFPFFVLLKLKLTGVERVKRNFIKSIIGGESNVKLEVKSNAFFQEKYAQIMNATALSYIDRIDRSKNDCYIVSGSLDIWLKPFSDYLQMKLICTEAQFRNGIFTGDFQSKNCTGQEKADRIKQAINKEKYDKTIAFGDSSGDKEMLAWADEGYYRYFK